MAEEIYSLHSVTPFTVTLFLRAFSKFTVSGFSIKEQKVAVVSLAKKLKTEEGSIRLLKAR